MTQHNPSNRQELFHKLFPNEPSFRWKQIEQIIMTHNGTTWPKISSISPAMSEVIQKKLPWTSIQKSKVHKDPLDNTYKALLSFEDGESIESVLMKNVKDQWTLCVSVQVGCGMKCAFCSTGNMGLKRSLTTDEIIDQYRFWKNFIIKQHRYTRISNIVIMGMGEPLANYDAVKKAINTILTHTDIGKTHITLSSVGLFPKMFDMLDDKDWPDIRMAISLHSPEIEQRKNLMPSSSDDYFEQLKKWILTYNKKQKNNSHYITIEYIMLHKINDTKKHAKELANFLRPLGNTKVNLIPYNAHKGDAIFQPSSEKDTLIFQSMLKKQGIQTTIRKSYGASVSGACGQLASTKKGRTKK